MKFSKVIESAIAEVKGSGFWSRVTEKRLRDMVATLKCAGIGRDETIADVIRGFWTTVSAEYSE